MAELVHEAVSDSLSHALAFVIGRDPAAVLVVDGNITVVVYDDLVTVLKILDYATYGKWLEMERTILIGYLFQSRLCEALALDCLYLDTTGSYSYCLLSST